MTPTHTTTESTTPAYDELTRRNERAWRLEHLGSIAGWDQAANMPPKGNEARAAALAELGTLLHGLATDPLLPELLDRAEQEPMEVLQRANLREMRRDWVANNALPGGLVEQRTLATARSEHAWRTQRPANDWAGFVENLRPVVRTAREEANCLSQATGLAPYDALIDRFEPGMRAAELERLFGDLRLAAGPDRAGARAPGQRDGAAPAGTLRPGHAEGAGPGDHAAAGLRLRCRPARREHPPLLRRRARGRAPDHPLPRR